MIKNFPSHEEWVREFQEFIEAKEISPPSHLDQAILKKVHEDLNPPALLLFSKLTLIHAIVGTLTLFFCPQFGFSPISDVGILHFLMRFGDQVCMFGCGAVFLGMSSLTASFSLRLEEIRVIRKTGFLQLALLALLSLGIFICAGLEIISAYLLFWLLGSIVGGIFTLELGWTLRRTWALSR